MIPAARRRSATVVGAGVRVGAGHDGDPAPSPLLLLHVRSRITPPMGSAAVPAVGVSARAAPGPALPAVAPPGDRGAAMMRVALATASHGRLRPGQDDGTTGKWRSSRTPAAAAAPAQATRRELPSPPPGLRTCLRRRLPQVPRLHLLQPKIISDLLRWYLTNQRDKVFHERCIIPGTRSSLRSCK